MKRLENTQKFSDRVKNELNLFDLELQPTHQLYQSKAPSEFEEDDFDIFVRDQSMKAKKESVKASDEMENYFEDYNIGSDAFSKDGKPSTDVQDHST